MPGSANGEAVGSAASSATSYPIEKTPGPPCSTATCRLSSFSKRSQAPASARCKSRFNAFPRSARTSSRVNTPRSVHSVNIPMVSTSSPAGHRRPTGQLRRHALLKPLPVSFRFMRRKALLHGKRVRQRHTQALEDAFLVILQVCERAPTHLARDLQGAFDALALRHDFICKPELDRPPSRNRIAGPLDLQSCGEMREVVELVSGRLRPHAALDFRQPHAGVL